MTDRISPRPLLARLGDRSGASEGITSVSKPKPLLEFRKIGFVLPRESSRNYKLYIYETIFFGWLWAPVNLGVVPKSSRSGTTAGSNGAVEATLMAYRFYQQLWGGEVLVSGLYPAGYVIGRVSPDGGLTFDRRW
jgi:hypothetical protein